MKETVKINLNQQLFDLDADAYDKLREYLDSLKNYFRKTPDEAEEILQDIEQRIAEILQEKLGSTKQVVTRSDVEEVIQLMGTAADFAREAEIHDNNEEYQEDSKGEETSSDFDKQHRRLYRDINNNIIGGVCSGIASYFNIDSVWIRLAFIILLFFDGIGFLAYLVMWIAMPAARTTAQKLQMKGQAVTIENIQQSVKKEFTKVKDNLNNFSKSESYKKAQHTAAETLTTLGNIFLVFLKVILVIVGIALVIAGGAVVIALVTSLMAGGLFFDWNFSLFPMQEYIHPLMQSFSLFGIALSLVILIPVVAILIGIIKLIFNVKSHNSVLSAFAWTFWVLALVFVIVTIASGEWINSYSYLNKENKSVDIPSGKVLYVDMEQDKWGANGIDFYSFFGKEILHSDIEEVCYLHPQFEIRASEKEEAELVIEHTAAIPAFDEDYMEELFYIWHMNDTVLFLNEYFSIDEDHIWQLPGMRIILFLPDQQKIVMDSDIEKLVRNKKGNNSNPKWNYNTVMVMKNGILESAGN